MKMGIGHGLRVCLCLLVLQTVGRSQSQQPAASEVQRAYEALRFEEAAKLGRAALAQPNSYTPAELVQLHLVMAYLEFIAERKTESRQHFESALSIQPDLKLDSLLVSPTIVRYFEHVKNEFRVGLTSRTASTKYVLVEDQRFNALKRSLLLPGWGQRHLQQRQRGLLYTLGFIAALGAGLTFHVLQEQAHDEYLRATDPDDVAAKFDVYNQHYRMRNLSFAVAGSVWAVNVLDILLISPAAGGTGVSQSPVGLSFGVNLHFGK